MAMPTKDVLLVSWTHNFSQRISAPGNPYLISTGQAAEMASRTEAFAASFNTLMTSRAKGTRAESETADKDAKKSALIELGRELYASIAASNAISDADKILAGIHVRGDTNSAVSAPSTRPVVDIVSVVARTITVNIYDSTNLMKRRKASGAISAFVFTFVGHDYPSDPTLWQFRGAATKSNYPIVFNETVPSGAQVWISAQWQSRRGETGPMSDPVCTNIQGGGSIASSIKIAA